MCLIVVVVGLRLLFGLMWVWLAFMLFWVYLWGFPGFGIAVWVGVVYLSDWFPGALIGGVFGVGVGCRIGGLV